MADQNIVIFGAGKIGMKALAFYGKKVAFFIDNNADLWGTTRQGILIKSVDEYIKEAENYRVVIANLYNQKQMMIQLKELGIKEYSCFLDEYRGYYLTDDLVYNPYLVKAAALDEKDWNEKTKADKMIQYINQQVEELVGKDILFDHVEIETVNRCNGNCDFCPVSKKADSREYKEMSQELFERIIQQLARLNYSGRLALFSNNEPFLDEHILERHKYAREKLPNARMHLFTNGTLLTIDKFIEIMKYLDELIIDNYQQELKLIKPCKEIEVYCEEHPELKKKVTIVLRKPHEILSSRGGVAPNRKELISYAEAKCVLPFKQMIIRPDGKVSLCCNDPLGKVTLGDLAKDSILDVWNNDRFKMVRKCLSEGRAKWKQCEFCDVFNRG